MKRWFVFLAAAVALAGLVIAGCTQAPPAPAPTQPPAAPTKAAEPTKAPPAPTPAAVATKAPAAPTAAPAPKVDYPTKGKAITLVIPWPAGGAVDVLARILAPPLERELGTSLVVVNKPGSTGMVGVTELIRSKPDGYTLGAMNQPTTSMTYLIPDFKAVYSRKDLQPIAMYTFDPFLVGVKSDSPFKTLKDLLDAAKANPEKVSVATSGAMGSTHIALVALEQAAGVKFNPVHFEGGPPGLTAVLGGHVDAIVVAGSVQITSVRSGTMRPLGIMDKEESKFFPGLKTMESQGYKIPPVAAGTTSGLAVPAGTPREITQILSRAVKTALEDSGVKSRMDQMTYVPRYMDMAPYATHWDEVEADVQRLLPLMKQK